MAIHSLFIIILGLGLQFCRPRSKLLLGLNFQLQVMRQPHFHSVQQFRLQLVLLLAQLLLQLPVQRCFPDQHW